MTNKYIITNWHNAAKDANTKERAIEKAKEISKVKPHINVYVFTKVPQVNHRNLKLEFIIINEKNSKNRDFGLNKKDIIINISK